MGIQTYKYPANGIYSITSTDCGGNTTEVIARTPRLSGSLTRSCEPDTSCVEKEPGKDECEPVQSATTGLDSLETFPGEDDEEQVGAIKQVGGTILDNGRCWGEKHDTCSLEKKMRITYSTETGVVDGAAYYQAVFDKQPEQFPYPLTRRVEFTFEGTFDESNGFSGVFKAIESGTRYEGDCGAQCPPVPFSPVQYEGTWSATKQGDGTYVGDIHPIGQGSWLRVKIDLSKSADSWN
jgi:hypothetical protein